MFDIPFKLFPPALLAALGLWGLAVTLYLQPLVESRMAERTLIPACEAGLHRIEATTPVPENPKRRELAVMVDVLRSTGLDQLPMTREIIGLAERQLDALTVEPPRSSLIKRNSLCACAVDRAFADLRWSSALHVASLRTHEPQPLKAIDKVILQQAASGACGPLPWTKG